MAGTRHGAELALEELTGHTTVSELGEALWWFGVIVKAVVVKVVLISIVVTFKVGYILCYLTTSR